MGKNGKYGKDYGKVVGKEASNRPGWRGPGYIKKVEAPSGSKKPKEGHSLEPVIPVELQQLLLNIFKDTFPEVLNSDSLQSLLQDVKAALYERDFNRAFGKEEYLEAYSIRWSPSRALCYLSVLIGLQKHLVQVFQSSGNSDPQGKTTDAPAVAVTAPNSILSALCFGGGAAEVVAFGGFLRFICNGSALLPDLTDSDSALPKSLFGDNPQISLHLVDTAQWGDVVAKLCNGLTTPPLLSKYASAAAKAANSSLIPSGVITTNISSDDVLALSQTQLKAMVGQRPMLCTLLFTLNELYTTSIGKTTEFLMNLTSATQSGTLLLIVDSPGSYSETTVGSGAKKYPMQWLLDHTLLKTEKSRGQESTANWVKIVSEDSHWFRLPDDLRYPISLENMRYQLHLYRRA